MTADLDDDFLSNDIIDKDFRVPLKTEALDVESLGSPKGTVSPTSPASRANLNISNINRTGSLLGATYQALSLIHI